ncbi:DUF4188 domain-containing protein [Geodermatophilus sp. SYSU D00691]
MADIRRGRYAAEIDGDFVVLLIGFRFNKPWLALKSFADFGGRRGMGAMLTYLTEHPEKGLLGFRNNFPTIIQYWRSFEHLEAFARDDELLHREAWLNWYRRDPTGRTGIWHETYLVRAGEYEAIYADMPVQGLAAAGRAVPLQGNSTARLRLRAAASADREAASAMRGVARP